MLGILVTSREGREGKGKKERGWERVEGEVEKARKGENGRKGGAEGKETERVRLIVHECS